MTTVDTLSQQFDAVFDGAMGAAQFGAAGSAAAAKGKLLGFMRERLEIGGVGEFSRCETPEDVVNALIDDHRGDARSVLALLDTMRALVAERLAAEAYHVTPGALSPQPAKRGSGMPRD